MESENLTIRKNRFISYIMLGIAIFATNTMNHFLYGLPFIALTLLFAHIKKRPQLMSYFVILFGFAYVFVKAYFEITISIPLIIFVFLSLSIVFQKIGTVIFSSFLSLSVLLYYVFVPWQLKRTQFQREFINDSMFFEYTIFLIIFVTILFCFQTYTFQKLQKKSEVETINAKKGRKKVNILLDNITESTHSLKNFSTTLTDNIQILKKNSDETLNGFEDMSETFSVQNKNVKTIDKSIKQIDENIKVVTNYFQSMVLNLQKTANITSEGYDRLKNLENEMSNMDETIHFLNEDMKNLNEQSGNIIKILDIITGISNKTNILALNASIEASRAGIENKSFVVIAKEVKNLAEKSKDSVKEIEEIIKKINIQTKQTSQRTKDSQKIVSQTKDALKEMKKSFDIILIDTNDTFNFSSNLNKIVEELSYSSNLIVEQILQLANANDINISEIDELFLIIEQQNEHIFKISEGYELLEKKLHDLSSFK